MDPRGRGLKAAMTYRDDLAAARERRDLLRRELEHLDDQLARAHALALRRDEVAAALAEAERAASPARPPRAEPLSPHARLARDVALGLAAVAMIATSFLSVIGGAAYLVLSARERDAISEPTAVAMIHAAPARADQ